MLHSYDMLILNLVLVEVWLQCLAMLSVSCKLTDWSLAPVLKVGSSLSSYLLGNLGI